MRRLYPKCARAVKTAALVLTVLLIAVGRVFPQTAVERRTVLDGTVTLEDAPEVPPAVREALRRYQNVRGAGFVDWTADGRGITIGSPSTTSPRRGAPAGRGATRSSSPWTSAGTSRTSSGCWTPPPGRRAG
jgi:hypothetical protein